MTTFKTAQIDKTVPMYFKTIDEWCQVQVSGIILSQIFEVFEQNNAKHCYLNTETNEHYIFVGSHHKQEATNPKGHPVKYTTIWFVELLSLTSGDPRIEVDAVDWFEGLHSGKWVQADMLDVLTILDAESRRAKKQERFAEHYSMGAQTFKDLATQGPIEYDPSHHKVAMIEAVLCTTQESCPVDAAVEQPDLYKEKAAEMYGIDIADVTKEQRSHGKAVCLVYGFDGQKGIPTQIHDETIHYTSLDEAVARLEAVKQSRSDTLAELMTTKQQLGTLIKEHVAYKQQVAYCDDSTRVQIQTLKDQLAEAVQLSVDGPAEDWRPIDLAKCTADDCGYYWCRHGDNTILIEIFHSHAVGYCLFIEGKHIDDHPDNMFLRIEAPK